jgi:hypothetical protein
MIKSYLVYTAIKEPGLHGHCLTTEKKNDTFLPAVHDPLVMAVVS